MKPKYTSSKQHTLSPVITNPFFISQFSITTYKSVNAQFSNSFISSQVLALTGTNINISNVTIPWHELTLTSVTSLYLDMNER